jgi:cation transport protein ChaC
MLEGCLSDLWVFGYGSLMWHPGFDHVESQPALLRGAHRSLCVYSYVHRGTEDKPGLVLGLDTGGSCRGIAFRVKAASADTTMVYREAYRSIQLLDGTRRKVQAICFLVDRHHPQYAGRLPVSRQAELVQWGKGQSGNNVEYVANTLSHLDEMGLRENALKQVMAQLR